MHVDWEQCESRPVDAERTVLLLPGGLNRAQSYEELMAQPALPNEEPEPIAELVVDALGRA